MRTGLAYIPFIDPKKVLQQMKNHGEVLAIGEYSGGNDEGSCEDVRVYKWSESLPPIWKPIDLRIEMIREVEGDQHDWIWGSLVERGDYEHECCIQQFFQDAVEDEYSTFAGEFYANGTMTIIAPNATYPEGMIDISGGEEERNWVDKDVFQFPKKD